MKTSKAFRKVSRLASAIHKAKDEARLVLEDIEEERDELDNLEQDAKQIIKL